MPRIIYKDSEGKRLPRTVRARGCHHLAPLQTSGASRQSPSSGGLTRRGLMAKTSMRKKRLRLALLPT
jgi:hypothetical protein